MRIRECENLVVRGARVIDPFTGRDERADVAVAGGRYVERAAAGAVQIDGEELIVCPGLMDIHVHLREPGGEHKETIETGTRAAAAGGFTFVACMPNTQPPLDTPEQIAWVLKRASETNWCNVGPIGAITRRRAGREVADLRAMQQAGAVAFSDDGTGVEDDGVMRAAFELARDLDTVLIQHCEYKHLSAGGVMHLGEVSHRLGLPGLDPRSEEAMIERDIRLCRETGARYHVAHVSTACAVELIRVAKAEGLAVTAEVCPHHLLLTDEAIDGTDADFKMHPPLRTRSDMLACRMGLVDGTIDCVATDHAPHAASEKATGFLMAPPGIIGLETALPLTAQAVVENGLMDWVGLIRCLVSAPAKVLGRIPFPLVPGQAANFSVLAPRHRWRIQGDTILSRSRNMPFKGWELTGKAVATVRRKLLTISDEFGRLIR